MTDLPQRQCAVQLVGPDELVFNDCKKVIAPGPHQILCRVEVVGLCFSDLKLLKQFSSHVRKGKIVSGIEPSILEEIPSYVPEETPTVPGHEAVVEVAAVGPEVKKFKTGKRYLVQADYRWLKTKRSNSAFGYNFEGALQEYVLMDERAITSPEGESMLLSFSEGLSASAAALVEPWACVEHAYASKERQSLKADGQMLVVADVETDGDALGNLFGRYGRPRQITWISKSAVPAELNLPIKQATDASKLNDTSFDDVVYFGSNAETVEALFGKVAAKGLLNIVLCGGRFAREVATQVGRVHYGGIRIAGTGGCDPAESMAYIPESGEIRPGDKINIIGAGGPMGMMHVIRNICHGPPRRVTVFAGDVDNDRLETLTRIAEPLAKKNNVRYRPYNPTREKLSETFDYTTLMAPAADLAASSVRSSAERGIINIFAGIAETVSGQIDLNAYIEKRLYFIGTSGSTIDEMKAVLTEVESGRLDTNSVVAAVCGLEAAIEGIRAVEKRSIAGKIIIYPACKGLKLVELKKLGEELPQVAEKLDEGLWNKKAEEILLKMVKW